jgi:UDP-N-acetylglucosamine 2-epimerase (non-hydrolysing)
MIKILIIFGTRPEVIKVAPVITEIQKHPEMELLVCNTGQHKELVEPIIELFQIKTDYSLNSMTENQSLAELTSKLIHGLNSIISQVKPDWILAQGDTTTVMCAALTAYYNKVKFGHIEAGLRTHDKYQPFPEEINRRIAGVIADIHFAPTKVALEALLKENIPASKIKLTGNTIVDAVHMILPKISSLETFYPQVPFSKKLILVTSHRRENFGKPFENICKALQQVLMLRSDIHIVFPVHYNPNVRIVAQRELSKLEGISLLNPLQYEHLLFFLQKSHIVLTDSGGIQEEGASFNKPILVMRNTTERPEGIKAGIAKLVGTDTKVILRNVLSLLEDSVQYNAMTNRTNPYGDGKAAERILDSILHYE